jgi:formylglycine-generating enzyme required for sulfatase activity
VQKEIEYFAAQGRHTKVFAIISDKAPLTDDDGVDATQLCFPPAFRGAALAGDPLEPIAADARRSKDGFRNAWLKIVAGMIGVAPGKLIDRDHQRRRRAAITTLTVWAIVGATAVAAYWQRPALQSFYLSRTAYRPYVTEASSLERGTVFQDCRPGTDLCPTMVILPNGEFWLGGANRRRVATSGLGALLNQVADEVGLEPEQEAPPTPTRISAFAVSQTEITVAQWNECVSAGHCPAYSANDRINSEPNHPVVGVTWDDAKTYAAWLSNMTGMNYRLLTSAEWEYAARGTTSLSDPVTMYSWGDESPSCEPRSRNGAVFKDCPGTHPMAVGSFAANAFGLYDMHGNVWEWVEDGAPLAERYLEPMTDGPDDDVGRLTRGGSFFNYPESLRSAAHVVIERSERNAHLGFRVARSINATRAPS